jgi:hypothetical protein
MSPITFTDPFKQAVSDVLIKNGKKKVGHSEFQWYLRNVPAAIRLYGSYG